MENLFSEENKKFTIFKMNANQLFILPFNNSLIWLIDLLNVRERKYNSEN